MAEGVNLATNVPSGSTSSGTVFSSKKSRALMRKEGSLRSVGVEPRTVYSPSVIRTAVILAWTGRPENFR